MHRLVGAGVAQKQLGVAVRSVGILLEELSPLARCANLLSREAIDHRLKVGVDAEDEAILAERPSQCGHLFRFVHRSASRNARYGIGSRTVTASHPCLKL